MKILVLNSGSSSIKFQVIDTQTHQVLAKGVAERIGIKGSRIKYIRPNQPEVHFEGDILDHQIAIEYVLGILKSEQYGIVKDLSEIEAVGHRVVHGGEKFKQSVLITDEVIKQIEIVSDLAPLHNPANLKGIYAISALLPGVPQVAVFDTAFHQTMPQHAYMYALPYSLYNLYKIRRYGFHGTSHKYVSHKAAEFLNLPYEKQKIISLHLGNGASAAAIKSGQSVDTSMGMTPLEGLIMGTRSGDLDVGAFVYILRKEQITPQVGSILLNKHSGVLGISGISPDMREIEQAAADGNERAQLALDMYAYRVKKYIGAYTAAMNGLDILIFTGGIGENSVLVRKMVCDELSYLGIKLDNEKNKQAIGKQAIISTDDSKVKVVVIPTNEELMIALDTEQIVLNK